MNISLVTGNNFEPIPTTVMTALLIYMTNNYFVILDKKYTLLRCINSKFGWSYYFISNPMALSLSTSIIGSLFTLLEKSMNA